MRKQIIGTTFLGFAAWCEWFVADQVELPFWLRAVAFAWFGLTVLGVVGLWHKR